MIHIKPKLRSDLRLGMDYMDDKIIIKDPLLKGPEHPGYSVSKQLYYILSYFDGEKTLEEIQNLLKKKDGLERNIGKEVIVNIYDKLKNLKLMDDNIYQVEKQSRLTKIEEIKYTGGSGSIFPDSKQELENLIYNQYKELEVPHKDTIDIKGVVLPHIPTYLTGTMILKALYPLVKKNINKFVIIGPNHLFHKTGAFLCDKDIVTPLGKVRLMRNIINNISREDTFEIDNLMHQNEHSIQTILPYLQFLTENKMEILPILVSNLDNNNRATNKPTFLNKVSSLLLDSLNCNDVGLIVSGDLSHFMGVPMYDPINRAPVCLTRNVAATINEWDKFLLNNITEENNIEDIYSYNDKINYCLLDSLYLGWKTFNVQKASLMDYYQTDGINRKHGTSVATLLLN